MKKDEITTFSLCIIIFGLITFSAKSKAGATLGLSLCENVIIPALLPILIITNTITKSKCSLVIEKTFGKLISCILHLPSCSAGAIIFGLIAGYPSGAILTEELLHSNKINTADAERIMRFNFGGGLAFVITGVGTICYGSTKTGIALYLSTTLSSIIIGIISNIKYKSNQNKFNDESYLSIQDALISSVEKTIKSILTMCAYIVLFSSIMAIIKLPRLAIPMIEITNGVANAESPLPLEYTSFFLAFGGICIHFQLLAYIKSMGISYIKFLLYRITNGTLSFLLMKGYLLLNPQSTGVFSNIASKTTVLSQVNTGLSIVLVLGCAIIILDIESKKSKLI